MTLTENRDPLGLALVMVILDKGQILGFNLHEESIAEEGLAPPVFWLWARRDSYFSTPRRFTAIAEAGIEPA